MKSCIYGDVEFIRKLTTNSFFGFLMLESCDRRYIYKSAFHIYQLTADYRQKLVD